MKKYVLVTGGQLFNKGAQAMTFITADEIAKRYPDKEVVLLSNKDYRRSEEEKQQYTFRIMPYPKTLHLILMQSKLGRLFFKLFGGKADKDFIQLVQDGAGLIDISGYALGSNWGYKKTLFYLTRLGIAHSVKMPVYLMPQSFGPLDYRGIWAPMIQRMLKKKLRYAEVIMCREQEGYELLKDKYQLDNLVLTPDLVLQNIGVDAKNVYRQAPAMEGIMIPSDSVAIIPNGKTLQYGNPEQLFEMYRQVIESLQQKGKQVFLIYHSAEDLPICQDIKSKYFKESDKVALIGTELSCLEFDELVTKFDFIIASRFHAVVHAYRNGIPAVVPGWAVKYQELLDLFEQGEFMFDVRGQIQADKIVAAVHIMCEKHELFSRQIQDGLQEIRKKNVYDYLKL